MADTMTGRAPTSAGDFYVRNIRTAGGAEKGVDSTVVYEPAGTSGYSSSIGVRGTAQIAEDMTFTGGVAWPCGVQGILDFQDGATINNASSVFAATQGAITASGDQTFTAFDTITAGYFSNHCSTNMQSNGQSSLIKLANHGGKLDHIVHIFGSGNKITNLFYFEGVPGPVGPGTASGAGAKITCLWGSTTYYINMYQ